MKELCFRVVNAFDIGLYQAGRPECWYDLPSYDPDTYEDKHPTPSSDRLLARPWYELEDKSQYFFGFKSLEQMRQWIYKEHVLRGLQEDGFRIAIYQTEDYYIGDTQMIFRKSTATLIGRADLI